MSIMAILEGILEWERELFLSLNGAHSLYADIFLWLYSGPAGWVPIVIFATGCIIAKTKWKEWGLLVLSLGLVILFCDLLSSHFTKPFFARLRPTHHPLFMDEVKTVFGKQGNLYGFVSGHSANSFGLMMFTALFFKYKPYTGFITLWAVIMVYSRIYLGMHFISDVVGGILAGMLIGFLVYRLFLYARRRFLPESELTGYSPRQKKIITGTIAGYLALFALISYPLSIYLVV